MKSVLVNAQKNSEINWSVLDHLPAHQNHQKNQGLAGSMICKINDYVFICGGSNFINGMPWDGYKKVYWNDIFILHKNKNKEYSWLQPNHNSLQKNIAYGASVQVEDKIVLIGGENEEGILSSVISLKYDSVSNEINESSLPNLPEPLTNCSAIYDKPFLYVIGGENSKTTSFENYRIEIGNKNSTWVKMKPIPKPTSNNIVVLNPFNKNCFVIVGGREKTNNGEYHFLNNVQQYHIKSNSWSELSSLPYGISAGTGVLSPNNTLLMLGGDLGTYFNKISKLIYEISLNHSKYETDSLTMKKKELQIGHPGFDNRILQYDFNLNKWNYIGDIPFMTPVTTSAILLDNDVLIISGEIKAGIRTPQILLGKITNL